MAMVKICGLRDEAMVRLAAKAGADWVGFNLIRQSPRFIAGEGDVLAGRLTDLLRVAADAGVRSVVLLADPDEAALRPISGPGLPDAVQLHGGESPSDVTRLRRALPGAVEVWKAAGVETRADLDALAGFSLADRLLIDAKPPKGSGHAGGHGNTFDWTILHDWAAPKPWFLAGGLTPGNVAGAIAATGAAAVDVSSGVERERGVKDEALVRSFIAAAKAA